MCVLCACKQHYIMRSEKWIRRYLRWPSCAHSNVPKCTERFAIVWQLNEIINSPSSRRHKHTLQVFPSHQYEALSRFFLFCHNYSLFNYFVILRASAHQLSNTASLRPRAIIFAWIFRFIFHSQIFYKV